MTLTSSSVTCPWRVIVARLCLLRCYDIDVLISDLFLTSYCCTPLSSPLWWHWHSHQWLVPDVLLLHASVFSVVMTLTSSSVTCPWRVIVARLCLLRYEDIDVLISDLFLTCYCCTPLFSPLWWHWRPHQWLVPDVLLLHAPVFSVVMTLTSSSVTCPWRVIVARLCLLRCDDIDVLISDLSLTCYCCTPLSSPLWWHWRPLSDLSLTCYCCTPLSSPLWWDWYPHKWLVPDVLSLHASVFSVVMTLTSSSVTCPWRVIVARLCLLRCDDIDVLISDLSLTCYRCTPLSSPLWWHWRPHQWLVPDVLLLHASVFSVVMTLMSSSVTCSWLLHVSVFSVVMTLTSSSVTCPWRVIVALLCLLLCDDIDVFISDLFLIVACLCLLRCDDLDVLITDLSLTCYCCTPLSSPLWWHWRLHQWLVPDVLLLHASVFSVVMTLMSSSVTCP